MNRIMEYLDYLFPNPVCELEYKKDYELLISIMLSAQTTDKRVNKVTKVLFNKYDTLEKLSRANISDLEDIIREIGTYKKKSIYIKNIAKSLLENSNGIVSRDRKYLESLSGIGRKTVNVFLSEFYDEPSFAVDTHVSRVSKRLNIANFNDSVLVIEEKLMKLIPKEKWNRTHKQMVLFGRYHCKAIKPNCINCNLRDICNKDK